MEVGVEVGMFSKILTLLCMEYNFDVSYLLCFSDSASQQLSFLDDKLIFGSQNDQ